MRNVTKAVILRELRRLGVRAGDILFVHSALSAFGKVKGGAPAVVDALIETVGAQGTLLMPTLTPSNPYDFRSSPSTMGAISEEFRKRPGTVRSLNPLVPAAGIGPRADEFLARHHLCECPYIGSPYDLAARAGGWVLLMGVDQDRNTTLHCAEAMAGAPYLGTAQKRYVGRDGKVRLYRGVLCAGPHRDFIGVDPKLRAAGIVRMGRIGNGVVRLMKGQEMIDFCLAELKKDPALFLTSNDGYYDGPMQRGKIRAARLAAEESFRLIVRTGSAGANLEEVLRQAERAGATGLEVDLLDGRDAAGWIPEKAAVMPKTAYDKQEFAALLRRIRARGLKVSIVRCLDVTGDGFERALAAAKALEAEALVAPLTGSPVLLASRARLAEKAGLKMLFENVAIASAAAAELLKPLAGQAWLAFNPANFAAAGEMPFLQSFRAVKKFIRYLAITDMYPLGVAALPGTGAGEVKELLSILRCSRFDGYISLGAAPGSGLRQADMTDAFYRLLDAC